MNKFTVLLFLLNSYTLTAQKSSPVITRYYEFTGAIDKYPVVLHLHRTNNDFSGSYYYSNTETPIEIDGKLDKTGFLKLTHLAEEENNNEVFEGVFKDSSLSGTWSYKGKLLSFRVAQKKDNPLQFDYIWSNGTKKIPEKTVEYGPDELSYEAATIWPARGFPKPLDDSIKTYIRDIFEEKNSTDEIGKILLRRKSEILSPKIQSDDEIEAYAVDNIVQVVYRNKNIITFSHANYSYTGGAHGNHGTVYTCFDLQHNRRISITDVMDTAAVQAAMHAILEKTFRANYASMIGKDEQLTDILFVEQIPVNNNFLLTARGIGFQYLPYEIAAYALGDILLYIPFREIEQYLKPEFKLFLKS